MRDTESTDPVPEKNIYLGGKCSYFTVAGVPENTFLYIIPPLPTLISPPLLFIGQITMVHIMYRGILETGSDDIGSAGCVQRDR